LESLKSIFELVTMPKAAFNAERARMDHLSSGLGIHPNCSLGGIPFHRRAMPLPREEHCYAIGCPWARMTSSKAADWHLHRIYLLIGKEREEDLTNKSPEDMGVKEGTYD